MFPFRFCFGVALRLIAYLFLPFLSPYFCPPPPLSHSFCRPHVSKEAKSPVCGATLNKLLQHTIIIIIIINYDCTVGLVLVVVVVVHVHVRVLVVVLVRVVLVDREFFFFLVCKFF